MNIVPSEELVLADSLISPLVNDVQTESGNRDADYIH